MKRHEMFNKNDFRYGYSHHCFSHIHVELIILHKFVTFSYCVYFNFRESV